MRTFDNENFEVIVNGEAYKVIVDNVGDDEVDKRWHDVILPNGERKFISWTPYERLTEEDFKLWLELGMPGREDTPRHSNLNHEILHEMAAKKL